MLRIIRIEDLQKEVGFSVSGVLHLKLKGDKKRVHGAEIIDVDVGNDKAAGWAVWLGMRLRGADDKGNAPGRISLEKAGEGEIVCVEFHIDIVGGRGEPGGVLIDCKFDDDEIAWLVKGLRILDARIPPDGLQNRRGRGGDRRGGTWQNRGLRRWRWGVRWQRRRCEARGGSGRGGRRQGGRGLLLGTQVARSGQDCQKNQHAHKSRRNERMCLPIVSGLQLKHLATFGAGTGAWLRISMFWLRDRRSLASGSRIADPRNI